MARRRSDTEGWGGRNGALDRDELRARIVGLLSSGSVAQSVRSRLDARPGEAGAGGGDVNMDDRAGAELADLFCRFLDDTDETMGVRSLSARDWKEKAQCSRI